MKIDLLLNFRAHWPLVLKAFLEHLLDARAGFTQHQATVPNPSKMTGISRRTSYSLRSISRLFQKVVTVEDPPDCETGSRTLLNRSTRHCSGNPLGVETQFG